MKPAGGKPRHHGLREIDDAISSCLRRDNASVGEDFFHEADAFAEEHKSFGDVIFSIDKVIPGEKPKSLAAAIDAGMIK